MIKLDSRITDPALIIVPKPEGIASPERVRYREANNRQKQTSGRKRKSDSESGGRPGGQEENRPKIDLEA
ncbi:MAG: hypothetical protein ACUVUU_02965 [bacterium]